MARSGTARARPLGGLAGKRQAILDAGLRVFGRDGYTRGSIDTIAAGAGVSTRTIYNHFHDKAHLFRTVIQESASRVAGIQIAIIDRHLTEVTDLEAGLVEFGRAFVTPVPETADHFAMVRQINAEVGHIPQEAIDAWHEVGPLRVRRALAERLRGLSTLGLRVDDPERAALHLSLLVSAGNVPYRATAPTAAEIDDHVTSGVRAFLHGYRR